MRNFMVAAMSCFLLGNAGGAKVVGLYNDPRSGLADGMTKTLQEAGYQTKIIDKVALRDKKRLDELDVIFLPGGWNATNYADFVARKNLVEFVAGGKGILAGAFRGGWTRTCNRPLFPEVGVVINRVNGPYVFPGGEGELAKTVDKPFLPGSMDHMTLAMGPVGKVFAVDGNGNPVAAAGEVFGGRYIVFGAFIGYDAKDAAMTGTLRDVFLKCFDYLSSAPKLSEEEKQARTRAAELAFLRRETLYDWTNDDRGPDHGPGVLADIRTRKVMSIESRMFRLNYLSEFLDGENKTKALDAAAALKREADEVHRNYAAVVAETTNRINSAGRDELLADNPFTNKAAVLEKIKTVPGKTQAERGAMITALNDVKRRKFLTNHDEYISKDLAMFFYGQENGEKIYPEKKLGETVAAADKLIAALEPEAARRKAAMAAEERAVDLAAVPDLIAACSSSSVRERREAVLELGRIGDARATAALIAALKDPDADVRVNAIMALGWLQAKTAVPELIALAAGDDLRCRRRALQALGQIGDARAIDALLAKIDDKDLASAENAILSLGWLKAEKAVPALTRVAKDYDRQDPRQRRSMSDAIVALGDIGDRRALPVLEHWAKTVDDFPCSRGTTQRIANIYSNAQELGLRGHSEFALEKIKNGGRKTVGWSQPEYLSGKRKFYALSKNLNLLMGRPGVLYGVNGLEAVDYYWDAGATGVHMGWGSNGADGSADPGEHFALLEKAGKYDFNWIDVMPLDGNIIGGKEFYREKRSERNLNKAAGTIVLDKMADYPAFQGLWSEEHFPILDVTEAEFEDFLKTKYGAGYRDVLGVKAGEKLLALEAGKSAEQAVRGRLVPKFSNRRLYAEYLEYCGERVLDDWREAQEWLKSLRKGCSFTYNVSSGCWSEYIGSASRLPGVIDTLGPENYQEYGPINAFSMELCKDGEARPVMTEFYNMYSPSAAHDVRGFAQQLSRGECFYPFSVAQIFAYPSYYTMWSWDKSRWENLKKTFANARKIKEYFAGPASAAGAAIVVSERTALLFYNRGVIGSLASMPMRYFQQQLALWVAMNQSRVATDAIWAETLTAEKLAKYKLLVLADAKCLTDDQITLVRQWVKNGGILISTGTTSLFNQWGERRENYALADVFGVNYKGLVSRTKPEESDTFCFANGKPVFKALSGNLAPDTVKDHVLRDVKPVKSLDSYVVTADASEFLPGTPKGLPLEYDMPLGYDKVDVDDAETLATFKNGDAALTVNKYGDGLCYFWTPDYPGLCYVGSDWGSKATNVFDFWPNVRELLEAMVKGGLKYRGETLPVEISSAPKEIELIVRQQPDKDRWIVHLFNGNPYLSVANGLSVTVHPPKDKEVKRAFYPDTNSDIAYVATDAGVVLSPRPFKIYDTLVVEWK